LKEEALTVSSFETAAPQEVADRRTDESEFSSVTCEFSWVKGDFVLNKVGFTESHKLLKLR